MKQVIAVTGGTGFIGQSICRRLSALGYSLRVLVRSPRNANLPALDDADIVAGNLADKNSLLHLVAGAAAVVHCAGNVRGATKAEFYRVNVEGTRNLLQAIKDTPTTPRLLAISSLAAREPQLSFYAASKRAAEQLLEEDGSDIAWTILRPPAVYGPGDREMLPLFRLMGRGIVLSAGAPNARFSMIYVEDVSEAVIAWLRNDSTDQAVFEIDDGQPQGYDWHDVGKIAGDICQRDVRVIRTPSWLLDLPAWVNARIGAVFGTSPMLTPEKLRELRHHDWVSDSSHFQQVFGWSPRIKLPEGLRLTPGWSGHGNH